MPPQLQTMLIIPLHFFVIFILETTEKQAAYDDLENT